MSPKRPALTVWILRAFQNRHTGERIATLEEAICLCEELDLVVFLDIKPFKTEKV